MSLESKLIVKKLSGTLYVVATPIGNLGDISKRAIETLASVDGIAAEDTRHSGRLLQHLGVSTPMISLHEHNEGQRVVALLERVENGEKVALISDAGTPLVADPGHRLVALARDKGLTVEPIPGPCAVIAALSASGLSCDRFAFEGFLSAKKSSRRTRLSSLEKERRTLVFYESPYRLVEMMLDLKKVFGSYRNAVIARELTKLYESWYRGSLEDLCEQISSENLKGEMVVVVDGAPEIVADDAPLADLLTILLDEVPLKQAASIAARISGESRNRLYQLALSLQSDNGDRTV